MQAPRDAHAHKLSADSAGLALLAGEVLEIFAHGVVHDLKAPLWTIRTYAQLLADDLRPRLTQDQREYFQYVQDAAGQLQGMLDGFRTLSEASVRPLAAQAVDSAELLNECLAEMRSELEAEGCTVQAQGLPILAVDRDALAWVLSELILNAVKFRSDQPPRVQVTARRIAGGWRFCVEDNGSGLDLRYAERAFLPFKRLAEASGNAGVGMGLAVCRTLVERHGGKIWVEAEPGRGSRFQFDVPGEGMAEEARKA